jgi:hypothetical protein
MMGLAGATSFTRRRHWTAAVVASVVMVVGIFALAASTAIAARTRLTASAADTSALSDFAAAFHCRGGGSPSLSGTSASSTAATPSISTVTWAAPVSCGRLSAFAFVTSLKCLAAVPMVHTIFQTGECAEGVASFLAPELELDKLLDLVRNAKSVKALQRAAGTDGPATGFVYNFYRAYQQPINPNAPAGFRSFKEIVAKLKNLHNSITAAATFLHDIPDLLTAYRMGTPVR